ncbi:proteasome regulatory particle base subunit [Blastocladiella emersonii ATCC 22665]|nr:proteasome regulatory particle base subunit [Blastocladiella emersonii ATCC 22665]
MAALTSAGGLVALLDEHDEALKLYALQNLEHLVDQFWPEIADSLPNIEILFEDDKFAHRHLAALVASKVYYHLGEFDDSLTFALGAGKLFDLTAKTEFVETIIAKCIDKYIALRSQQFESDTLVDISPALEDVVERMFQRCFADAEFRQAIGIALEARRLDVIKAAIEKGDSASLLQYVLDCSLNVVQHRGFRNEVLRLLVQLYSELKEPDYLAMGHCLVALEDDAGCAQLLDKLADGSDRHQLLALQLAFDLEETASQQFLRQVGGAVTSSSKAAQHFHRILSGEATIQLHLEFLHRNNHADLLILKQSRLLLDGRSSLYHSSVSFANAIMNAGTTSDQFLRDNLEWLSRANNWSKFSATAALGVIHKGNLEHSMALLKPYLPQQGVAGSPYSEGGALYALGLMNANHAQPLEYLRESLKGTTDEVLQHGACLGIGVSGMATGNHEIYEDLKATLFTDSAVAGEAAGLAMGLTMVGSGNVQAVDELLQYAHDTQHEKIIRGAALGIALIMYGKEEEADATIDRLLADKDALIRYGGIYAVALAYTGTGNNKALRRLLHVAVSDVNDDVRRAAVTSIGFVLSNNPSQVPRVVELLSESFNPNVRYGACLALGISCASTNQPEALQLLAPLLKDSVDYVRQGALIAQAMIQMQHTDKAVKEFRAHLAKVLADKHEAQLTKFGAVLAQGILDAGGRNANISLRTRSGTNNMLSVVGMAVFLQFWYWYPLTLFLSLSLSPTALIALDADLRVPQLDFVSNAKPSAFAYPPATAPPTTEKVEKVQMALSTTAKAKARAKKKEEAEAMDVVPSSAAPSAPASPTTATAPATPAVGTHAEAAEAKKDTPPAKEPAFETKANLTRVLPAQEHHVSFAEARYVPVKKTRMSGILLAECVKPDASQEFIELSASKPKAPEGGAAAAAGGAAAADEGPEPAPPAPFEFPFDA